MATNASNLVIVESPAKAKTIEKYLGSDFVVQSSFGHVRDLPKSGMGIDIEGKTFEPEYEITADKKKVMTSLRKYVKQCDTIWLASDPDREGEAISWHLYEALNLSTKNVKRITFPEITKPAVLEAVSNPGEINKNLVDAQQARRVLDRLVGYELSPVLWRKIQAGLSAGRVQSVAVRLIVEREKEIEAFESTSHYKVSAEFTSTVSKTPETFTAEVPHKFPTNQDAKQFLEQSLSQEFILKTKEQKPAKRNPAPPFTTSTLQQKAGMGVKRTMMLAQRLYEAGKITYMRTDSVNLSNTALESAKKAIISQFGEQYHSQRRYKTKSKGAQEAHEAIRPTDFSVNSAGSDEAQKKLYNLIWRRAIASQMASAEFERTVFTLSSSSGNYDFVAKGEVITFDGFLKVYGKEDSDSVLPNIAEGEALKLLSIEGKELFSKPPARYTEPSLVKILEEKEIGRPSTYAPTISTIQDRGYVMKGEDEGKERKYCILSGDPNEGISESIKTEKTGANTGKLVPTSTGTVVNTFLTKHFTDIVDYDFTARVEKEFDEIEAGEVKWNKMITEFYTPFHDNIEHKMETVDRSEAINERILGDDPKSGKPVSVRIGRYGAYVQIGTKDDDEKPVFASLKPGQKMDTISFDEALDLFNLPRIVGQTDEGHDIKANYGRFGPYIQFKDNTAGKILFQSLKDFPPESVPLSHAQELVLSKRTAEKEKYIKNFREEESDIEILKGRWGPYVTDGEKNIRVPKDIEDATVLTLKECKELLKKAPAPKKKRASKKTTAKKTTRKKKS